MSQIPSEEVKNVFRPAVGVAKEDCQPQKIRFDVDEADNVFRMFEETEEVWRKPFSGGIGVLEDLLQWSQNLACIGEAISWLADLGKDDIPSEIYGGRDGGGLGNIIQDYAYAINCVVGNKIFRRRFLGAGPTCFSLPKHQQTYEMALQGAFNHPLEEVEREIKEVEAFIEKEATPSFSLLNKLNQLRETIIVRMGKNKSGTSKLTKKNKGE